MVPLVLRAPLERGGIGRQLPWQFKLKRTGPGPWLGRGQPEPVLALLGPRRVWTHLGEDGKESASNEGDPGSLPGSERAPGGEHGNPLQVFLPGKSHGQRSRAGCSPWGHKESHTTERLTHSGEPGTRECGSSQGAGGQVCVLVFELPVQGEAPLLSIVGQEGGQRVDLAERRAGCHCVTGKKGDWCGDAPRANPSLTPSLPRTQIPALL